MKNKYLIKYWFEFENLDEISALNLGCGVTAYNYSDALQILTDSIFKNSTLPKIRKFIEDVDVSTLDSGHILPNMGLVTERGIWFPLQK